MRSRVTFAKLDPRKQIAIGAVYEPGIVDSQGDFMTAEVIEKMAHDFMRGGRMKAVDEEHNLSETGACIVESFIAREGDPDFPAGSWVAAVHIPDKNLWAKVEGGQINGFSVFGSGRREERTVEIDVPDDGVLKGETFGDDHRHSFALRFAPTGEFTGGDTDEQGGHTHKIVGGTITEPAEDGHVHRFVWGG
jgi:hypothetical protein